MAINNTMIATRSISPKRPFIPNGCDEGAPPMKRRCYSVDECRAVTPSPQHFERRVRFNPTTTAYYYSECYDDVSYQTSLTDDGDDNTSPSTGESRNRHPRLWYTKKDRSELAERNRRLVHKFRMDHMDKVQHYLETFHACTEPPTEKSSDFLEQVVVRVPTYVRGLESGIIPPTKQHRRIHSQEVLSAQEQLRGRLSQELRVRVLSTRAIQSSRPSRVMARLLAEGDALSAAATAAAAAAATRKRTTTTKKDLSYLYKSKNRNKKTKMNTASTALLSSFRNTQLYQYKE